MQLKKAKAIASGILGVGKNRVWINPGETQKVQEAMTKQDLRGLVEEGIIAEKTQNFQSRGRARELARRKKKGRKKGAGKRKGTKKTRMEKKRAWIKNARAQRKMLKELREKKRDSVGKIGYARVYRMIKGNYFRGKRHVEAFLAEKEKARGENK